MPGKRSIPLPNGESADVESVGYRTNQEHWNVFALVWTALGMNGRRAVCVLVLLSAFMAPVAAWAKSLDTPLRVVAASGSSHWVRGVEAKAWWHDYFVSPRGSCRCLSPEAAARYAQAVARRWGDHFPTPILIAPTRGLPSLYYPATVSTPAYVFTPGRLGDGTRRWAEWMIATRRMRAIVRAASTA